MSVCEVHAICLAINTLFQSYKRPMQVNHHLVKIRHLPFGAHCLLMLHS